MLWTPCTSIILSQRPYRLWRYAIYYVSSHIYIYMMFFGFFTDDVVVVQKAKFILKLFKFGLIYHKILYEMVLHINFIRLFI